MIAKIKSEKFTPDKASQLLSGWFAARHTTAVMFKEEVNPERDPASRYCVVYEAGFFPSRLDQACIELWVTAEGLVAVGFERWERIAKRLGAKNTRSQFAAGDEPSYISESYLLATLNIVADGRVALVPTIIPLIGLVSVRALVKRRTLEPENSGNQVPSSWLCEVSDDEFSENKLVKFDRWS